MAELLVSFDQPVSDDLGEYHARAVGRHADDGMWEGWIEFTAINGSSELLVTGAETRQPEHKHLVYWATGLTAVFLEGALQRARNPVTVRVRPVEVPESTAPRVGRHSARACRVALSARTAPMPVTITRTSSRPRISF